MTVRFNPPPGWPAPPATWVPHDDWLPDPTWPEPPEGWTFWSVANRAQQAEKGRRRGRLSAVSFPVATVAAQSTVSLAALFPDRARQAAHPTYGGYGTSGSVATGGAEPTKAGREFYRPRAREVRVVESEEHRLAPALVGSVLNGSGPVRDVAGRPVPQRGAAGTAIDPTVVPEPTGGRARTGANGAEAAANGVADAQATEGADDDGATEASPGIRLSPILRLVAHSSGLRVQFKVGGAVASALAEVLVPAIEAAATAGPPRADSTAGRGGRQGRLRLLGLGRRSADAEPAAPGATGSLAAAGSVPISGLVERAFAARRDRDLDASNLVERELCTLHRRTFVALRPPTVPGMVPVSTSEEAAIRRKALDHVRAGEKGLSRSEATQRKKLGEEHAAAFVRASNVARAVFAGRRAALAEGAWQLLVAHDPATVVSVVDEALRLSGSDVTCIDAGVDPVTQRSYVTVLVRFAPIVVVGDDGLELTSSGKRVWRARTLWERNAVYAAGLSSAVLAAAKQVDSLAVSTDMVNVVVVRPTRNGQSVEPLYVGTLDREEVSLRHPDADPVPLVIASAAPGGLRIEGPDREVMALERSADTDGALMEIVQACRAAMEAPPGDQPAGAGAGA